jgi:hypothetical protein
VAVARAAAAEAFVAFAARRLVFLRTEEVHVRGEGDGVDDRIFFGSGEGGVAVVWMVVVRDVWVMGDVIVMRSGFEVWKDWWSFGQISIAQDVSARRAGFGIC